MNGRKIVVYDNKDLSSDQKSFTFKNIYLAHQPITEIRLWSFDQVEEFHLYIY